MRGFEISCCGTIFVRIIFWKLLILSPLAQGNLEEKYLLFARSGGGVLFLIVRLSTQRGPPTMRAR
jgi:hypothetical protein